MPGPEQEYTTYEIIGSALLICLMSLPVLIGLLYAFVQINKGKETDYKYSLTDKHEFTADITADKDRDRAVDICFFLVLILYVGYTILEEVIMK